ncbi:MBOAT family O-acyltransferase [Constantimarinum furrinae]|nr:MBOAT family protein [Constantimarinum furrinae]
MIGRKKRRFQNVVLLLSSYVFYGLWDWRFLGLLIASSLIDFIAAKAIHNSDNKVSRKLWLAFSIFWNLGILITFKYFNFFIGSFAELFSLQLSVETYSIWNVIIPVGLSFYTFQTMSYTIDVFRRKQKPTKNLLEFCCFVAFFPQLVAGPIERANKLLPQFESQREFSLKNAKDGLRQILWGLFKKILVADKLGIAVTMVYNDPEAYGSLTLIYATVLFCFQIYCDFSGYTDIALGTAKLFGFKLSKNFHFPYLSQSITNLWQRWHITLTNWFTDYVYIPFVKSRKQVNFWSRGFGLLITMVLVGLWHGANWTFVAFGLFNGIVLVAERIPLNSKKYTLKKYLHSAPRIVPFIYVFIMAGIAAVFFRAENIDQAALILKRIFTLAPDDRISSLIGSKLWYFVIMIIAEMLTRKKDFPLQDIERFFPRPVRWVLYYILIFLIIRYAEPKEAFLYFQF